MIKAIIFDCFGVLVTDGWLPFAEKYFGVGTESRQEATDLMTRVNRGMTDYGDFSRRIAQLAHVSEETAQQSIMRNAPNERLFDYIKSELKPRYKIGLLSNTGRNRLGELFVPAQIELFDELVLSYEIGFVKPEPGAYQVAADRLGVAPNECVFIDDQEKRCVGARAVGMQAILYQDFPQMKDELQRVLAGK